MVSGSSNTRAHVGRGANLYLLDANDYPAGEEDMPADKAALDKIMIVAAE